jgi:hypothetical protein
MRKRKSTYEFKSNEDYEHHVAEDGGWPRERDIASNKTSCIQAAQEATS